METTGYHIPRRTLNHWISQKSELDGSSSPTLKLGRPRLVDEAGSVLLVGYCLTRIRNGKSVHLRTIQDFCRDHLGCEISSATASNLAADHELSSRIAQVSSTGICVDLNKMAQICSDWINAQRQVGLFSGIPLLIGSIDFTYTKHTTSRPTTFAIKGGCVTHISS